MYDKEWHWEFSFSLTHYTLLIVLGLVVATLWWRAVADFRGLHRKEKRNIATQNGDASFWHARWRNERVNVVLEFTMAVIVTLASACVLAFLLPYY